MVFAAYHSRPRLIVAAIGCASFAVAGVYIAGLFGGIEEPYPRTGWGIALACLLACALFASRLASGEVQMRIDDNGVDWKRLKHPIPWDQITGASIVRIKRTPLLCITLKHPAAYPLASPFARVLAVADGALGFGAMGLNTIGLDRSFEAMVAAVRHYRPDLFEPVTRL